MRPVADTTSRSPSEAEETHLWTPPERRTPAAAPVCCESQAASGDQLERVASTAAADQRPPPAGPTAPPPPFERTTPTVGLAGDALARAEAHNDACWREYASAYLAYLEQTGAAFDGARTLEALRAIDPEPPADVMPRVGQTAHWERLDRAYRRVLEAKVDRGYALLGSTPPGTLQAVFSAVVRAGSLRGTASATVGADGPTQATLRASVGSLEVARVTRFDGSGSAASVQQSAALRLDGGLGMARIDSNGNVDVAARVGPARVATNARGDLQLQLNAAGGLGGSATYRHASASFGGGLSAGIGAPGLEARATAELQMRGLSEADVRRALSGWLAATREPEAEAWLRDQRAAAALSP